jgi:hypothetical protein
VCLLIKVKTKEFQVGPSGLCGRHAVKPVTWVLKNGTENASSASRFFETFLKRMYLKSISK